MAIQIRNGTNTEWESNNSNIVVGEPAIATDAERFFVGTASGDYAEFANLDIIAPVHDTSTSYVVGDVVNRQGKLYSCNTPCSGAFNVSYWDEKSLAEILKDLENEIDYAQYEIGYASGELITIDNGASEIPVKDLTLDIEAVQSGSGDPSPTNVRPISGWDEVNVNVRGINVWDEEWEVGSYYTTTGGKRVRADAIRCKNIIPVIPNTSYYFKCVSHASSGDGVALWYQSDGTYIGYISNKLNQSITAPSNAWYMTFYIAPETTYNNDISINYPSTDHDYHAYNGQTYTIDLDGTRYGGTLDVTTGVLTVTHEYIDLGTYGISGTAVSSNVRRWYTTQNPVFKKVTLCNSLKTSDSYVYTSLDYASISTDKRIAVTPTWGQSITTVADFNTAIANNPISVVIELATPQVVQLNPTQVRTVLGTNNLWNQMNSNNELAYRISNALN